MVMQNQPELKPGKASMRKKSTDKYKVINVDEKALATAEFTEQFENYNILWNRFKDSRNWEYVQEHSK